MMHLSELIIAHPEVSSFAELEELVVGLARDGQVLLYLDIRPEYLDTPRAWQERLERVFHRSERPTE
jgi:hypothetical protein